MATFSERLPKRRDVVLVGAACVVPIYSWAIVAFLQKLPSWSLFVSIWEIVGAFSYSQLFAFFESALFLVALIAVAAVLPRHLLRERFAAQAGTIALLSSGWAVALQQKADDLPSWSPHTFAVLGGLYLLSIGLACILIHRFAEVETGVRAFIERLTVLLYLYVPLTVASLVVAIVRNVL
ncbi:MAG: hypothetical protein ACOC7N_04630 [Chloroflexota bacterium]